MNLIQSLQYQYQIDFYYPNFKNRKLEGKYYLYNHFFSADKRDGNVVARLIY